MSLIASDWTSAPDMTGASGKTQALQYDGQPPINRRHPYCSPATPMGTTNTHTVNTVGVLEAGTWKLLRMKRTGNPVPSRYVDTKAQLGTSQPRPLGRGHKPFVVRGLVPQADFLEVANHS